jgi:PAS domain S-box-containing protein
MHEPPPTPATRRSAQRDIDATIERAFTIIGYAGALTIGLLVATQFQGFLPGWRLPMALLPLAAGALVVSGLRLGRRARLDLGYGLVLLTGFVTVTVFPLANGTGIRSTMPAFYTLIIIAAGVFVSLRAALFWGAASIASVVALFALETPELRLGEYADYRLPSSLTLALDVVLLAFATGMAAVFARGLVSTLHTAKEQEHRFRKLLAIASDVYWEQDRALRLTLIAPSVADAPPVDPASYAGKHPWELDDFVLTPQEWQQHRADLDARKPFLDLLVRRPFVDGQLHYFKVSGEPVLDDKGSFLGYWGIARRADAEIAAQRRLEASVQLYQELFSRAASAFVLHRNGLILQANAAAARLFGFESEAAMVGLSMLELDHPSSREVAAQRIEMLAHGPVGGSLPVIETLMQRRDGAELYVQASAVRVSESGNPANLSVYVDLTERRHTERALGEAKEQAEAANRAKSRFLANMSHEIRTPLNGVLGLAQLALGHELDRPRLHGLLAQLVGSAEHLARIVSAVLDLSKIEAGEMRLEAVAFDLHALLDTVTCPFAELARSKELDFRLEAAADLPRHVRGDPTRLKQVLGNYLANALKFTQRGGITVRARADVDSVTRFEVHDTGIGIDEATLGRLFVPFSQADDSMTRRFGGTGLGLAICRELAELQGGRVGVESTPGRGSCFWVEMPLPPCAPPEDPKVLDAVSLAGLRVLLAEDNDVNMLIARALLDQWGIAVTGVRDGAAAIEAFDAADGAFDIVLMDLHMPVMGGLEATAALRLRAKAQGLPIIGLSAAVFSDDLSAARAAGMDDYLGKPYSAGQLREVLARWVLQRRS